MRYKKLILLLCLAVGIMSLVGCNNNGDEGTTTGEITTEVTTEPTTEDTSATTETPAGTNTSSKDADLDTEDEPITPSVKEDKKGTGVYEGLADSHSIEVKMSDGQYMTFLVYDEKLFKIFDEMEPGTKISFKYGPLEGQINPELKELY